MPRLERTKLAQRIRECRRCDLYRYCNGPVPGEGPETAQIVFVARNPGETEDLQNRPLVGKAGAGPFAALLRKIGVRREEVGMLNVVSCFTTDPFNRPPTEGELESCSQNVVDQLKFFRQKKVVVAMGREAVSYLWPESANTPLAALEGQQQEFAGVAVFPLRHPSFFLRDQMEAKKFGRLKLPRIVEAIRARTRA